MASCSCGNLLPHLCQPVMEALLLHKAWDPIPGMPKQNRNKRKFQRNFGRLEANSLSVISELDSQIGHLVK